MNGSAAGRSEHAPAVLEVEDVRKVYGGEAALAGASLAVGEGEIHGLIGANGAGKSTLVKIICGVETQDSGRVRIDGRELPVPGDPRAVREAGCAYIHQDRALAADLSITENVALTVDFPRRSGRRIDWRGARRRAAEALALMGVELDPDTLVRHLPIAEQTVVAIARALVVDARLLLLDEPTASLGHDESRRLYEILERLRAQGMSSVLITHALGEALDACDRITVLRNGVVVGNRPTAELDAGELTTMMLGHALETKSDPAAARAAARGEAALIMSGARGEVAGPLDLTLHRGEILAVTGLIDCGHLELGGMVAGLNVCRAGSMSLDGRPFAPPSVRHALAAGVGYVPSDRLAEGLGLGLTLRENLFLNPAGRKRISRREETRLARRLLAEHGVKPVDPEAELSTLSGGNMQKVLLARWLYRQPSVLVLSEPTVGVDVGAREDIYSQVRQARDGGTAVLLVSSDFEEVVTLADRAVVLRIGHVVTEFEGEQITVSALGRAGNGTFNEPPERSPE
jgi:ABC-type sugar transport system ATPase subunit